jgi:hypothetical protein
MVIVGGVVIMLFDGQGAGSLGPSGGPSIAERVALRMQPPAIGGLSCPLEQQLSSALSCAPGLLALRPLQPDGSDGLLLIETVWARGALRVGMIGLAVAHWVQQHAHTGHLQEAAPVVVL